MRLLLDTHVLLWALLEPQKLSPALRDALENSDNTLVVNAATAWEIASKWWQGKLPHARAVVESYSMALHRLAAVDLAISGAVARQAGLWPGAGEHGSGVCPVRRGDDVAISHGARGIRGCPASGREFHPRLRRMLRHAGPVVANV